MASNVAASMKASIIIDKKEIISSALSAYAEAQKEIAGNKIELLVDVSDDKARERLKEISKELAGKDYVIKFKNQGIEETMKSLDELFGRIKDVINLSNGININPINLDTNIHALQQEEAELKKVTDSYEKLLDLKHKIKNVNKSSYSGKHNTDWIGIYSSQEEAITNELADNKQKLHSSINLILSEDKNALSALEEEANRLKTALQSVQDMVNRISSNSSLSHLDENKGSEEWYKGYAEAYKAIDDRLAELHSQYRLTNEELEEYVTLQIKAEKIMEKMVSHNGGVQASGASSKAELKSWIEKSFARDLGLNPDDIYDGLFGNITDAMYGSGIGISLFDAEGAKRNLRELSAEVLKYKSATSVFDGAFGANEDAERLREISSVLTYIKKNMSEIESTDFSAQIKQATDNVEYFSKKLAEGEHTDFYSEALEKAQKELQELIELQERLNVAKRQDTDVIQTPASNAVEQLEKQEQQALATAQAEEKLAETEKNLGKSASTVDDSKFDELKADVTEIREELNGVKEKISAIDSEGFEHVKADVEKTVESVKELNSELTEVKSKLDSTSTSPVETNISSENSIADSKKELSNIIDISSKFNKSLDTTDKKYEKIKNDILTVVDLYKKMLSVNDDFDKYNEAYSKTYDYVKKIGLEQNVYWNKIWQGVKTGVENDNYDDLINGIYSGSIRENNSITEFNKEVIKLDKILQALYGKSINYKEVFLDIFNKLRDGAYSYDKALNKIQEDMNNKPSDLFNDMLYNEGLYPSQLKDNKPSLTIVEGQNKIQEELDETVAKINNVGKAYDIMAYRGIEAEEAVAKASKNYNGATHWSSDEKIARGYGDIVTSGNISLKNAFEVDGNGAYWDKIQILGDGLEENSKKAIEFSTSIDKVYSELSTLLTLNSDFNKFNPGFALYSSIGEEISKLSEEQKSQDDSESKITSEKIQRLAKIRDLYADLVAEYDKFSRDTSHPYGLKTTDELTKYAQANGYDGAIYKNIIDAKHSPIISGNEYIETSNIIVSFYENQVEYLEKISRKGQEYIRENISNLNISSPIEDTFQGDTKVSAESSTSAVKEEAKAMEQVAESAEKASKGKDKFAKANKKVKESADSSSKAVSEEASEFNKIIGKLDGYNTKLANFTVKPADGNRYPIYQKNIDDLTEKINKLQVLSEKDINLINTNDVEDAKALQKQIDELIFKMSKMSASEKGFDPLGADKALEKIHNELQKNSGMSKEAKRQIQSYYDEIRSGNPSKPIKDLLDDMYKLIQLEREAGRAHKSFKDIFKEKVVYGAAANMAGMIGIYDIINVGREGITVIRELDTALTEMRKVSDESISTLKEFQGISFDIADTIGTTAKQIQNSTADWMRLGYSISEASALAENSNIYKNVGDMEIDEATEHMVSSVQAWKSEFNDNVIETSEAVINRYNKIGNEFAISSADIGEAMETSAAALKAGGNSLNESLGLLTAGNIIQQDASTTSAALKILSLRIRGAKAELEEMGESTDGLADSSSKMREELKALTGVDIMLDEDTFKSTAQIIQEMGENWSKMTDVSQAAALEKIAGKNRASTVAGLIENYETIAEVIEAAENAEGSALAENEKYLDSIDGKMQQLENRAQEFWFKLIDSEAIKDGIDLLSSLVKGTTDFVDAFGVLGTAGLGAGLFASFKGAGRVKIAYPHLYTYACRNKTLYA